MSLEVVILSAGQGTRMKSSVPKVLHQLAGKPMLEHVVKAALSQAPTAIHVIYGHQGERVQQALCDYQLNWVKQQDTLGTGHAVKQALPFLADDSHTLILSGDAPLLTPDTLARLYAKAAMHPLVLLTADFDNPFGLGRICRDELGAIKAIVEEKDASTSQKAIQEIYSGIMLVSSKKLKSWLPRLSNDNAQHEFYLTDIVAMAVAEGVSVGSAHPGSSIEVQGVNCRAQLNIVERYYQMQLAKKLMQNGVTLADSARIDIRGELRCAQDVFIDINAVFEGVVDIEEGVSIGANCVIKNARILKGAVIAPFSMVDGAVIGENSTVGPFARLRPGSQLGKHCKVGNFVEMKKAALDDGAKASHLSYIGDATVGKNVNIGAGTITCNYDGVNKHQTVIGDGAFIGSGTQLIAPINVGENATIGAGTTLRKSAPAGELTLSIKSQKTLEGWARPVKSRDNDIN